MANYRTIPSGDSVVGLRQRPGLNHTAIAGKSFVPTPVSVGIISGYSLPVTNGADDEWLNFKHSVPRRWDQKSNFTFNVMCYLASANTNKKFQLNLAWEHFGAGDVVPATSNAVPIETDTGTAAQYTAFLVSFPIDYDIDGADVIVPGDTIVGRLSRIAASSLEISGEVVIADWYFNYWRGFYGGS